MDHAVAAVKSACVSYLAAIPLVSRPVVDGAKYR
jgi:hypothetical protein